MNKEAVDQTDINKNKRLSKDYKNRVNTDGDLKQILKDCDIEHLG